MNLKINKLDEVWTADHIKLGLAKRVFHREQGVNPGLELYASYLKIGNFDLGTNIYVPIDFIHDRDSNGIELTVTFEDVQKNTWSRMPHFIAHGEARREELPEASSSDEERIDRNINRGRAASGSVKDPSKIAE